MHSNRGSDREPDPPEDEDDNSISSAADVIDRISDAADHAGDGKVTIGRLLDEIGHRSHGPLLLVPALIALLPTGAVPTVPTIMGVTILLISVQIVFAGDHVWLPEKLENAGLKPSRVKSAMKKARPWAERLDVVIRPRLKFMTRRTGTVAVAVISAVLALLMPPLELIPFAVFMPATVLVILAMGVTIGDGAWVIAGMTLALAAVGASLWLVWGVLF